MKKRGRVPKRRVGGIPTAADLKKGKQQAHKLIDRLTSDQVAAVVNLLRVMALDPVSRKLTMAPIDNEPETEEERQSVAEAKEWLKHNPAISMETVLADFGLTMKDFHEMGETPLSPRSFRDG